MDHFCIDTGIDQMSAVAVMNEPWEMNDHLRTGCSSGGRYIHNDGHARNACHQAAFTAMPRLPTVSGGHANYRLQCFVCCKSNTCLYGRVAGDRLSSGQLKPGFHYPSWRPELTGDRFPLPVLTGARFPLAVLTLGPSTRVVETELKFYQR